LKQRDGAVSIDLDAGLLRHSVDFAKSLLAPALKRVHPAWRKGKAFDLGCGVVFGGTVTARWMAGGASTEARIGCIPNAGIYGDTL
jgi:hypothetical protein